MARIHITTLITYTFWLTGACTSAPNSPDSPTRMHDVPVLVDVPTQEVATLTDLSPIDIQDEPTNDVLDASISDRDADGGNSRDTFDTSIDQGTLQPGACTRDEECDDSVVCTLDRCQGNQCVYMASAALCPAGSTCDPRMGCQRARVCARDADCTDNDPCTTRERCDMATRYCLTDPLDGDSDGFPPYACGGTDCNDANRSVHPGAIEICNGRDDNCDGNIDEGMLSTLCPQQQGVSCRGGQCLCPDGQASCISTNGTTCLDILSDPNNCGACGRVCGNGGSCVGGACQCAGRFNLCLGVCVDLLTDAQSCGACGRRCGTGQSCSEGECRCPQGQLFCNGICINMSTANCGSCGFRCPRGDLCVNGTCGCPGGGGHIICDNFQCTDWMNDNNNCGGCGLRCEPGSTCQMGACSCRDGGTRCGGECVDIRTNDNHCGQCNRHCGNGTCVGGVCQCNAGATDCGAYYSVCVDLQTSNLHCGSCNRTCYMTGCIAGVCDCEFGTRCNGECIDRFTDSRHCGSCGNACPNGTHCINARCV